MSNMKCPVCNKGTVKEFETAPYFACSNEFCPSYSETDTTEYDILIRTRKALGYAIDVIQTVAKMSDKLSKEYGETLVEQLDNIQAYCWQEGYVLTHEEDLEKAITALEQKDK